MSELNSSTLDLYSLTVCLSKVTRIKKLQRELEELKKAANLTLMDNPISYLQQIIAHPVALFDQYTTLAASEEVMNVAHEKGG